MRATSTILRFLAGAAIVAPVLIHPLAAEAEPKPACAFLAQQIEAAPPGPLFLASYPTVTTGPLKGAAFLYDNAAAVIALVGCGQTDKARRIGDAMLLALAHDRFWHDGRLRNGYAAGPVGDGPVKLAGWWDEDKKQWLEDRYQVGSDNGNMAWAMLALLALDRTGLGADYRAGAERIGHWVVASRGPHDGFTGGTFGHEPDPAKLTWTSTEHNTDLAAAFGPSGRGHRPALLARAGVDRGALRPRHVGRGLPLLRRRHRGRRRHPQSAAGPGRPGLAASGHRRGGGPDIPR